MKKTVFLFIIFFSSSLAFAETGEPNIIAELQDSINQLKLQISNLQKIIDSQEKELARLKKICADAGIDITSAKQKSAGISEPIYGIYLGESLKTLKTRLTVSKSKYVFAGKNSHGQIWSVQNNDPGIKHLLVCTFNEQVCEIDVEFTDAGEVNRQEIRARLEKDYQTIDQNIFETTTDGVNIRIELSFRDVAGKKSGLTLTYIHVPIVKQMYAELEKQKAAKTN